MRCDRPPALNELSAMFGDEVRATFDSAVFRDWGADPLFRGAYSYPRVGSGGLRARLDLARPHCDERLYFAGEGVAAAHPACVFGAMESAQASVASMRLPAAAVPAAAAEAAE